MNYKVPGIIGGVGPASTLDYYNDIVNGYREITKDDSYPNLVIKSVDMTKMLSYLDSNDYNWLVDFLKNHIQNLKDAGAEFAAIASNTPHIIFDELKKVSPLPLVSIVESTCKYAVENNYKSVLILGTKFTMQSTLYTSAFEKYNIKAVVLNKAQIEKVHSLIFPKLEQGIVVPEDKKQMVLLANEICNEQNIDAVVLGCTEIPIMIKQGDLVRPVLNTTEIHVHAILQRMFEYI
ncbi:MAG: amino acid racemase [Treponema sp.]